MDTILLIISIIAVVILLWVLVYFGLRFLKGEIQINLKSTTQNSGEVLSGTVDFKAKKEIESNGLSISLVGYEEKRSRGANGRSNSNISEVYRNTLNLEGNTHYDSGIKNFNFNFKLPYQEEVNVFTSTGNNTMDMGIKAVSMISGSRSKIKWKLEATLDAEGVDLSKKINISINLSSSSSNVEKNSTTK